MKYEHPLTGLPVRQRYVIRKFDGSLMLFRFRWSANRWANRLATHNGRTYRVEELPERRRP